MAVCDCIFIYIFTATHHPWMHLLRSQTQHMPCHGDKDPHIVDVEEFGSEWNMSDTRYFVFTDVIDL
jgi:hypothetical protein